MKMILKAFCVILICSALENQSALSQICVVAATKMNVAYIGIDNPLSIVVSNHDCKELIVSTNNGTITKEENCNYRYKPERPGSNANIIVGIKKGNKTVLLDSISFRIKYIPDPVPQVGGKSGGVVKRNLFRVQLGVIAALMNFEFDARYIINSFTLSVVRNSKLNFTGQNIGASFAGDIAAAVKSVEAGDVVIIEDIKVKDPNGQARILSSITFHIIAD